VSALQETLPDCPSVAGPTSTRRRVWDILELVFGYALILGVIWTQRPLQRWLYWIAIAWFTISIVISFPGWQAMGCRVSGFWRSLWIVGLALIMAAAATMLAESLHTLHHPSGFSQWVFAFGGYAVWSLMQQFLLQGYFLLRLVRLMPNSIWAAFTAATVFALAHLPNPILTPATLFWGLAACLVFLKWRNVYTLAMAHAIFGICVAITIPAQVLHNMRVGRGYFTYRAPQHNHRNHSDHRVSTVAWVMDEAPTRR
jgi:hypothetical protein